MCQSAVLWPSKGDCAALSAAAMQANERPGALRSVSTFTALVGSGIAQSIPFDIRPSRVEAEVNPGAEKTVSFLIKTGAGAGPGRQTVTLESTDWTTQEDGSLKYAEPGTTRGSAVPWIKFSPSAFASIPSAGQLVRITIAVPPGAAPGVYRSGIFVQERPPATLPAVKESTVLLRVRYVFFLYVIVQGAFNGVRETSGSGSA
jgi:hypothetical protein